MLAWSRAGSVLALYLAFAGIGLAGTAVLYEPAFATVNAYFDTQRQNALLTLTMVAGLASTIFVPAAALLITHLGWRGALLILAAIQAVTAIPHFLFLRQRPADQGWNRNGAARIPLFSTRLVAPSLARTARNSLTWVFTRRGGRICAQCSRRIAGSIIHRCASRHL